MLSDRDKAVIENMCGTGMELDTIKAIFPKFDSADIETVYNEKAGIIADKVDINISCNCS